MKQTIMKQIINPENLLKEYKQTEAGGLRVNLNHFFRMNSSYKGASICFGEKTRKQCVKFVRRDKFLPALVHETYHLVFSSGLNRENIGIDIIPSLEGKSLAINVFSKDKTEIASNNFRIPFELNVPVFIGCYNHVLKFNS